MKWIRLIILSLLTLACVATEVWLSVPGVWQMLLAGGDAVPVKRVAMAALAVTIPPAAATCWRKWRHVAARGATTVIAGFCWVFALSIAIEGAYTTAKQNASIASIPTDKARADWVAAERRVKDKEAQIQLITENRTARQLKSSLNDKSVFRTERERKQLTDAHAAATEKEKLQLELADLKKAETALALKIGTTNGSATLLGSLIGGVSSQEVVEIGQSLLILLVVSLLPEGVRHVWGEPRSGIPPHSSATPFDRWAAQHLVADPRGWVRSEDAAGHYAKWLRAQGLEPDRAFYRLLAVHGRAMQCKRSRKGDVRGWSGMSLRK